MSAGRRYGPLLDGRVDLLPDGVAVCRGECAIGTTLVDSGDCCAFSFQVCSLASDSCPCITFGVVQDDSAIFSCNYFPFLARLRNDSIDPPIPSDGLGIPIRVLVRAPDISLYVNEVLVRRDDAVGPGELQFFIVISETIECFLYTPFVAASIPLSFFPYRRPRLWSQYPVLMIARGSIIRGGDYERGSIYAEKPLEELPGHPFIYYEVELRFIGTDSGFAMGFAEDPRFLSSVPVGRFARSVAISSSEHAIVLNGREAVPFPHTLQSGHCVGIGVRAGRLFVTFDGRIVDLRSPITVDLQRFIPAAFLEETGEIRVNFGQLPFAFDVVPVFGWCLWTPPSPDDIFFAKGCLNESHLLHFFLAYAHSHSIADPHVARAVAPGGSHYEVTTLQPGGNDLIGIGFSDSNFDSDSMVGWRPKTIGVHSDDGGLFYEAGTARRTIFQT
jgi:hypothetical protein